LVLFHAVAGLISPHLSSKLFVADFVVFISNRFTLPGMFPAWVSLVALPSVGCASTPAHFPPGGLYHSDCGSLPGYWRSGVMLTT